MPTPVEGVEVLIAVAFFVAVVAVDLGGSVVAKIGCVGAGSVGLEAAAGVNVLAVDTALSRVMVAGSVVLFGVLEELSSFSPSGSGLRGACSSLRCESSSALGPSTGSSSMIVVNRLLRTLFLQLTMEMPNST